MAMGLGTKSVSSSNLGLHRLTGTVEKYLVLQYLIPHGISAISFWNKVSNQRIWRTEKFPGHAGKQ